jgi:peptidoglycan/xylan/chitin deacetylase (PgdA/CDA1 family)
MIKKLLESVLYRSPYLTNRFYSGEGYIFMLHRVLPIEEKVKYEYNASLAITPSGLEKFIKEFQSAGFDIVSLDEAFLSLKKPQKKKFICFTIDDGYKDNLTFGLPVFEKMNVPFTVYISSCFPEKRAVYWWYFLETYIKKNESIDLSPIGIDFKLNSFIQKQDKLEAFQKSAQVIKPLSYEKHKEFAFEICGLTQEDLDAENKRNNMTWDEIFELNTSPLVTIGAHTIDHVSLKNQSSEKSKSQIQESISILENKLGDKINHFAYPYGALSDAGEREFNILKSCDIKSAVFNHPGSIFKEHLKSLYQVPRIGLTDETEKSRLDDFFSGRLHLIFNGLKKVLY